MELENRLNESGCRIEEHEMELWGRVQNVLRALEVHQLVSKIETLMQDAAAKLAQDKY